MKREMREEWKDRLFLSELAYDIDRDYNRITLDTVGAETWNTPIRNKITNFFSDIDFHWIQKTTLSTLEGDRVHGASHRVPRFH